MLLVILLGVLAGTFTGITPYMQIGNYIVQYRYTMCDTLVY